MYIYIYIYVFVLMFIPFCNQTWLAGKSLINGGFDRKITDKWSIFNCHV